MVTAERRADAQGRLRKAHATLVAARALLNLEPPCRDDAVNRASVAALQAARALVDSQWARDSQPHWDPNWRPGMSPPGEPRDPYSVKRLHQVLDRFEVLARGLSLEPDFTDYVRTLVEDGLEADTGEAPEYDDDEARVAIETAQRLVLTVAGQIGVPELALSAKQRPAGAPAAINAAPITILAAPAAAIAPPALGAAPAVVRSENS
jgi:hypothetical protein